TNMVIFYFISIYLFLISTRLNTISIIDEPSSYEHITNQEHSFHTSVIDMTISASPMYSLGLQINPFASFL
ncbi:hypothetical protein F4703DRAFT_1898142, partial [Phycomyces blakesleeanus]